MSAKYLETIRAVDGKIFNLKYHQKRYESVLNSLSCSNFKNLGDYLSPPREGTFRCRVVYSVDEISVVYYKYEKKSISSLRLVYDDAISYSMKSIDRAGIEALYALKGKADDILIIKNSLVSDTSIANIAFKKGEVWITPSKPLLKGTTRARLLDEGVIIEAEIGVEELKNFSQVALLNAMVGFDRLQECEFLI